MTKSEKKNGRKETKLHRLARKPTGTSMTNKEFCVILEGQKWNVRVINKYENHENHKNPWVAGTHL